MLEKKNPHLCLFVSNSISSKKMYVDTTSKVTTRASNRNKHPGQPDVKGNRRSKQEVTKSKEDAKAAKKKQELEKFTQIQSVAALENAMAVEDDANAKKGTRGRGRQPSVTTVKVVRPIVDDGDSDGQSFMLSYQTKLIILPQTSSRDLKKIAMPEKLPSLLLLMMVSLGLFLIFYWKLTSC
jgi:hypothetical protein